MISFHSVKVEDDCAICQNSMFNKDAVGHIVPPKRPDNAPATHGFHRGCVVKLVKVNGKTRPFPCPTCRAVSDPSSVYNTKFRILDVLEDVSLNPGIMEAITITAVIATGIIGALLVKKEQIVGAAGSCSGMAIGSALASIKKVENWQTVGIDILNFAAGGAMLGLFGASGVSLASSGNLINPSFNGRHAVAIIGGTLAGALAYAAIPIIAGAKKRIPTRIECLLGAASALTLGVEVAGVAVGKLSPSLLTTSFLGGAILGYGITELAN